MTRQNLLRTVMPITGICTLVLVGLFTQTSNGRAQTPTPASERVVKGLQIAPVPLNLQGKDIALVGLGSYIVNAVGGCNDCHTNPSYANGGDPYQGQPKKVNAAGYLGGGQEFGPFISRNITPDASGTVADGYDTFVKIMRTGFDPDNLHPQMGPLLQVMPWASFQDMTDQDLQAIYAYLSSIPCLEGGPGEAAGRCGPAVKTTAIAGPKNAVVTTRQFQLDGTASTSFDGKALTYQWSIPPGTSANAGLANANTAAPLVQFSAKGPYTFQLTVTDSAGKSATDMVTVTFVGN